MYYQNTWRTLNSHMYICVCLNMCINITKCGGIPHTRAHVCLSLCVYVWYKYIYVCMKYMCKCIYGERERERERERETYIHIHHIRYMCYLLVPRQWTLTPSPWSAEIFFFFKIAEKYFKIYQTRGVFLVSEQMREREDREG